MRTRIALLWVLLAGCTLNPLTGRRQLMLVDTATERQLGAQAYQELLGQLTISNDPAFTQPLARVGRRIAAAAAVPEFDWEFHVIVHETANAFCLPGGKIGFFTGIYPILQDEAGMAFVMGHEVAHAMLRHGGERMSQQMVAGTAGALLNVYLGAKNPDQQQVVMAIFGIAANVGFLLPYSRLHESEADRVGLQLMARAGYDPRQAIAVWERMAQAGGAQPPEFLSTHPSHGRRVEDLQQLMPEALALFESSDRAAVAALPHPEGPPASESSPPIPGASALVQLQSDQQDIVRRRNGSRLMEFEFAFDRDVYVESVEIAGPEGARGRLAVKTGIPAGSRRKIAVSAPAFPAGRYALVFRGEASGRPFTLERSYDVR